MEVELYKKHRPKRLQDVIGQDETVAALEKLHRKKKLPQAMLFTGPSGTGKTTLARILMSLIGCKEDSGDLSIIDAVKDRGIDTVREVRRSAYKTSLSGGAKGWIFDEPHQMRADAQDAMLSILEDTPENVYFILATTDPHKLRPALKGRCTTFALNPISDDTIKTLIKRVAKKENKKLHSKVADKIVEVARGSARNALVSLHKVLELSNWKQQLKAVSNEDTEAQAIDLCRKLMDVRAQWNSIAAILTGLEKATNAEPETVRRMILGYARTVLLRSGNYQAYLIIGCFKDHFYDSGAAGLAGSAYQVFLARQKSHKK